MPSGYRKDGTKLGFQKGHIKSKYSGWKLTQRICESCGISFMPSQPNQRFCGSKSKKTGCSYNRSLENRKKWTRNNSEYYKTYSTEWHKRQYLEKTEYYFRQKRYRNVEGSFTYDEWISKLEEYNYRCAKCGVHESELEQKYKRHKKLTIDHVIPVSKGGTNYISNIVPMCIGCNSRKKDREPIVGYIGATMDLPHKGHVRLLERSKQFCDYLYVSLNKDDFIERFKGKKPIMSLDERVEVIKSMWMVDEVVINEYGEDSKPTILKCNPDIIFVGNDYNTESYMKQMQFTEEWLNENGIALMFLPRTEGISSSDLKRRIENAG